MNYYRFPENRITKALLALYLFVMLYLCRSTMYCLYVVGFYPSQAIILGATVALGCIFLWFQRKNLKAVFADGRIKLLLIVTAVILVPMVLKRDWQFMYFSILLSLYISIFLTYFISWRELAKYYVVMLCALGVYSLLAAYVFRIPIDMGLIEKEVFRDGRDAGIYNFYFAIVPRTYEKIRNFGMFREPGVYQYFIILALFLTHYGVRWRRERSMWIATAILSVVMISTMATGGLAELALLAVFVFFDKKLYRHKVLVRILLVLAVVMPGFLYYNCWKYTTLWYLIELNIIKKFTEPGDSLLDRTQAIVVNLEMFKNSPIFGGRLSEVLHSVENNTSSTMILLAVFGMVSGLFHVATWVALVCKKERNLFANLYLLVVMFLSFNTQNMTWDLFFWLFPVMALTETCVPWIERRGKR